MINQNEFEKLSKEDQFKLGMYYMLGMYHFKNFNNITLKDLQMLSSLSKVIDENYNVPKKDDNDFYNNFIKLANDSYGKLTGNTVKNSILKIFNIFDKHGLFKDDLCFDQEHFIETVVIPELQLEEFIKDMEIQNLIDSSQYELSIDELKAKVDEYDDKIEQAFHNSKNFEEYLKISEEYRKMYCKYNKEYKIRQTPKYTEMSDFDKDCLMHFERFVALCLHGGFIDDDGEGYYATEDKVTDILCAPSDIIDRKFRTDFTHVCWYNK